MPKLSGTKKPMDGILFITIIFTMCSLVVFVVVPLVNVLIQSFRSFDGTISGKAYVQAFTSEENLKALTHSLVLGVTSGVLSTVIGFLFAYCASYVKMKWKSIFNLIAMLPIVSPPFAVALSIILLFGSRGLITYTLLGMRDVNVYGFRGLLFAQTLSYFPIAYLLLNGVLSSIDPSIEEASRNMGGSRGKTFIHVTLPLTLPGIANSFLLVFIKSVADFGNPITIGGNYQTLATQIYYQAIGNYDMQGGAAVAILLLLISMSLFAMSKLWIEKKSFVTITGKASRKRALIDEKHIAFPLTTICYIISFVVIGLYILIPLVSFVKLWGVDYTFTFENYRYAFGVGRKSLRDSTIMAALATPVTGILAMITAFLIVRKRFTGRKAMEFVSMLGMTVPGTVMGIGYVLSFNTPPLAITGTMLIIVLSYVFRYLPIGVQSGVTALKQIDPSIEEAAADLGANSFKTFVTVTLPLIKTAFFGGLVYTFVKSMTSVSAVIFLVSARYKLLTVSVLDQVDSGKFGVASAMSTMLIAVVYIAIAILYRVIGLLGVNKKDIKLA
ncbi:iron ABC transporter permease [Treponema sp. Marseille-Q4132]|uniref:ABC transporter permease n=1 Tax=Treponema sp. Marseille-Q4132 TaxID=2766701 RepID=UPI001652D09A|nr:iron ABC transporter permease [Treponema sp. Marseille-Q4132]QNL97197.1 iron ABC transporter permease [Treponema sp. Marseille-Q4132]